MTSETAALTVCLALASLGAPLPLVAQAAAARLASVSLAPVGPALRRSTTADDTYQPRRVSIDDDHARRRRAFHLGAAVGAALGAAVYGVAWRASAPDGGDTDTERPGARWAFASVLSGAVLGGVAGVILRDVHDAAARP